MISTQMFNPPEVQVHKSEQRASVLTRRNGIEVLLTSSLRIVVFKRFDYQIHTEDKSDSEAPFGHKR
jgi:hypothetical protein